MFAAPGADSVAVLHDGACAVCAVVAWLDGGVDHGWLRACVRGQNAVLREGIEADEAGLVARIPILFARGIHARVPLKADAHCACVAVMPQ